MPSALLQEQLQSRRALIDEAVKDLHQLTLDIGHEALAATMNELRNRLNEPFMFVVVGEVKSGKSSFVNALLGAEVTEVAPDPCTDTVQQILYGEAEQSVLLNAHLKKIFRPIPILQDIAIVDTPGTNTISEQHQAITEAFVPASDLIVFVFEAKNPYRQSAWQFFDFIHGEWRKKVIFVLQQADLMEADDLRINVEGVRRQAEKKGLADAPIFAVSAKREQRGELAGSGYLPLRAYIRAHITGGRAPWLKLRNNLDMARHIGERLGQGLREREAQWQSDRAFRQDVQQSLDEQQRKSDYEVDMLVENVVAAYDRIVQGQRQALAQGLGFFPLLRRSFGAMFSKDSGVKSWLEHLKADLEKDLKHTLGEKLQGGTQQLADSVQQMVKLIDLKIRHSKTVLPHNHDIFSDIAERRAHVVQDLQAAFQKFAGRSESFTESELLPGKEHISPNMAAGSGMAVIGLVLAAVTQGAVLDITGGLVTALGLLFAGITASIKRHSILKAFDREIGKGRQELATDLDEGLKSYIARLKNKINGYFHDFDALLESEARQLEQLQARHQAIGQRLAAIDLPELDAPI